MNYFSIILPVLNGGSMVKECIASILGQTYPHFNLVILDSGSTDNTIAYINSLADSRINLIRTDKPLSIEENWHRVLRVKKNEFITLIGYDDILDANFLSVMDDLIKEHPAASLYQAHFRYIDETGKFKRRCRTMDKIQYAHEFIAHQFLDLIDSTGTGYVMRAVDYESIGGIPLYPNLIFADYELWVRLTAKNYKATALAECFSYREHNSVSRGTNGNKYQEAFGRYINFLHNLVQQNQEVKEVTARYGATFLMNFCQALSHRLLKTEAKGRSVTVKQFIDQCIGYAQQLIPGQVFEPRKVFKIKIAEQLDNSGITRSIFNLYKKL